MKITIDIDSGAYSELTELYEVANRMLEENGHTERWSFEQFCTICLELGAIPHMIGTARVLINSTKKKYDG